MSKIKVNLADAEHELGDLLAWDRGQLAITNPALTKKLTRTALSPSTAKAMEGCPARWVGERLLGSQTEDPFGAAELGTAAHSVLEDLYDLPAHKRGEDAAMRICIEHSYKMWPITDDMDEAAKAHNEVKRTQWISAVHESYRGIFEIEDPTRVTVRRNEWQMKNIEIEGVPFLGYIDRTDLVCDEDGKPVGSAVVDYKTSKKMPVVKFGDAHGDQLRLYAVAVEAHEGVMPTEAWVYYTKLGKAKKVALAQSRIRETVAAFKRAWVDLNRYLDTAEFPTVVSPLCGWCPLIKVCPTGQLAGKEAKVEVPSITDLGIPTIRKMVDPNLVEPESEVITERDLPPDSPELAALDAAETGEPATPSLPEPTFDEPDPEPVKAQFVHRDPAVDLAIGQILSTTEATPDTDWAEGLDEESFGIAPDPVPVAAVAALDTNEAETGQKETTMNAPMLTENDSLKPWMSYGPDGRLNPNSYSAIGVFGIAELAVESLHSAGQPVTGQSVKALAQVFASVVAQAQSALVGSADPQMGANTRVRGALRTVLETMPLPFGGDDAAWAAWHSGAIRRCNSIATVAIGLFENPIDTQRPWGALV